MHGLVERWDTATRIEGELSLRTMSLLLAKKHIWLLRKCCIVSHKIQFYSLSSSTFAYKFGGIHFTMIAHCVYGHMHKCQLTMCAPTHVVTSLAYAIMCNGCSKYLLLL